MCYRFLLGKFFQFPSSFLLTFICRSYFKILQHARDRRNERDNAYKQYYSHRRHYARPPFCGNVDALHVPHGFVIAVALDRHSFALAFFVKRSVPYRQPRFTRNPDDKLRVDRSARVVAIAVENAEKAYEKVQKRPQVIRPPRGFEHVEHAHRHRGLLRFKGARAVFVIL